MSEPVKCPESDERCGWTWTVSGSERVCRQPSDSIWHNHSPACPPDCNQDADACHPFTPNSPEKPDSCHVPVLIYSDKYCESCGDRIEDHPNPSGEPNGSAEPQEMTEPRSLSPMNARIISVTRRPIKHYDAEPHERVCPHQTFHPDECPQEMTFEDWETDHNEGCLVVKIYGRHGVGCLEAAWNAAKGGKP